MSEPSKFEPIKVAPETIIALVYWKDGHLASLSDSDLADMRITRQEAERILLSLKMEERGN